MILSRFIPLSLVALLVMSCSLPCSMRVMANEASPAAAPNPTESNDELTPEQVAETMEYLTSNISSTVVSLLMTMSYAPGQWKNYPTPEVQTFVPLIVTPPSPPTDGPGNGGGGTPTPTQESPEPGTLIAGLAGASAFAYRYFRRRRAKADVAEEMIPNEEAELAM